MYPTLRLLQQSIKTTASKSSPTYIPPFSVTGITGIVSHPFPRPVLIGLYANTLNALSTLPPHSIYRTSTENLTKSRLSIIESVTPPGYDKHLSEITPIIEKYKAHLKKSTKSNVADFDIKLKAVMASAQVRASVKAAMETLIRTESTEEEMEDMMLYFERKIHQIERDLGGIPDTIPSSTGDSSSSVPGIMGKSTSAADSILPEQTEDQANSHMGDNAMERTDASIPPAGQVTSEGAGAGAAELPLFSPEPPLTAAQIHELEQKLGGGLIEEVINQGFAELKLVEEMKNYKPWEELEEAPVEGQWTYFERKA